MFSEEQLNVIFSNVEQIYVFHMRMLQQLRAFYNAVDPCASEIGAVFLDNVSCVDSDSIYASNHLVTYLNRLFSNVPKTFNLGAQACLNITNEIAVTCSFSGG